MSFAEIANERGLTTAATLLGELSWDVEPEAHQRPGNQELPATGSLEPLFELLTRLSLLPSLASALLDVFPADRPMERALIAYDIATRSLLGTKDSTLLERIRKELAPLRQLGPLAPVAIPKDRVEALMDAVRPAQPAADADLLIDGFKTLPSLALLVQLAAMQFPLKEDSPIVNLIMLHVRTLASAHLPSLAVAFLQVLWKGYAMQRALDLMVELAIDGDVLHALPDTQGQDDHLLQLQAYLRLRLQLAQFNTVAARQVLEAMGAHPAVGDSKDPRLLVARAELDILERTPIAQEVASRIADFGGPESAWRYGQRVSNGIWINRRAIPTVQMVDDFITRFGNDPYMWAYARPDDEARAQLLRLLSREVRFASHDPNVWRAVTIFVENGDPIGEQLDQRMKAQLESLFDIPPATAPSTGPNL